MPGLVQSQTIIGKWQLVKQSSCIDENLGTATDTEEELLSDMKSRAGAEPQVITFRENKSAEENTKIINSRKNYNSRAMLYKMSENMLYLLDKKSQTIIESFTIEQFSADSLIISNSARACETKVFVKIK